MPVMMLGQFFVLLIHFPVFIGIMMVSMLVLMCMHMCTYVLPRHVTNARMCPIFVSCMCVCVFVSVCMSVCMYVCGHVLMGVCVYLHASMPAFTHVSTDVHDTRTIAYAMLAHACDDVHVYVHVHVGIVCACP